MDLYSFDDDYVRRLREGDRWTEEHFLSYFQQILLIKLRGRVRSSQAIDDIRQEVFLRVFRSLRSADTLRDGRKLGAFVNSICNNVLFESFRANGRTEALADDYAEIPDPGKGVDETLLTGELKARVQRVLDGLPEKDANILRAVFLEERDKDEICRAFHVDRNYLRVVLHRAKEKFRNEYASKVARFRETPDGKPSLRP
ncbi:MAG: polymerase sigma-70 factor, family [Acidobacteria bacterium]|nr:polymerase sigma-70 factor, family [Acidobacteriota bacterium]